MERADAIARAACAGGDPRDLDSLRADITDTLMFGWPHCPGGMSSSPHGRGCAPESPEGAASYATGCATDARPRREGGLRPATAGPDAGNLATPDSSASTGAWFERIGRKPAAHVTVVVPFSTAVGLTEAPCELVGHGWVTAEHARQIMLGDDSTWRRLAVDADSGAALQLETRAYRPTAAMRAHVGAVDGTCRAPGCTVAAARCDLDHDIPWPQGPTEVGNLTSNHRPHHNAHTHGHWSVRREGDRVRWRTKAGRVYDTYPKDWLEPLRPAPPTAPGHRGSGVAATAEPAAKPAPPPF